MEIKLTKDSVVNGSVEMAGTVVTVDETTASGLISSGDGTPANAPAHPEPQSIPTPKVKRVRKAKTNRTTKE